MGVDNFVKLLRDGNVSIPKFIFDNYTKVGLSDLQFLVIIHMFSGLKEGLLSFNPKSISDKMSLSYEEVLNIFDELTEKGYINIITIKTDGGIYDEKISLDPFFNKVTHLISSMNSEMNQQSNNDKKNSIFQLFEQEFSRPLTPIEFEIIMKWIEEGYKEEIIKEALKESIMQGVQNFRYIDRILIEWKKKNLNSISKIREYSKNYKVKKSVKKESKNEKAFRYNWLEDN